MLRRGTVGIQGLVPLHANSFPRAWPFAYLDAVPGSISISHSLARTLEGCLATAMRIGLSDEVVSTIRNLNGVIRNLKTV